MKIEEIGLSGEVSCENTLKHHQDPHAWDEHLGQKAIKQKRESKNIWKYRANEYD